jgi:hypothetical protein
LGYTLVENYNPLGTEHTSIEDLWHTAHHESWTFVHRSRFKQRYLESDGEVANRWRFFTQMARLLSEPNRLSLALNEEVFFHLNAVSSSLQQRFAENRAFAGLSMKLTPCSNDCNGLSKSIEGREARCRGSNEPHSLAAADTVCLRDERLRQLSSC